MTIFCLGDKVTEKPEVEGAHTHGIVVDMVNKPHAQPPGTYLGVQLDNGNVIEYYADSMRIEMPAHSEADL